MTVRVNNEPRAVADSSTLESLMRELGLFENKGIAAALNGTVVPKKQWPTNALKDADKVLLIRATQGG